MLAVDIRSRRGDFILEAAFTGGAPGATALFGRSGSGKSTLVAAIAGLLRGATGHVRLGDETWLDSARGVDVAPEHRGIGCVFQDPRLFPHLCVRGNLDYAVRRSRARRAYVERGRLVELLDLGPLLERRPAGLSGGERSRVALARALLSQPKLLILDEPFASLDLARRMEVLPFLDRLRDEYRVPIIYVSHQYEEVLRLATGVVLIDAGRVRATGTPASLARHPELAAIAGSDWAGAVVEGPVLAYDAALDLATVAVGGGELKLPGEGIARAERARVLVPARDVLLASAPVHGLSVRNQLRGTVRTITADSGGAWLVEVGLADTALLARVTGAAIRELDIREGCEVYALVKAESLRGHAYRDPA